MKENPTGKILVALSGGVDSSTAAAILKEKGFMMEGAIMVFEGVLDEDIDYASRVAQKLNIPFHVFDFAKEYQEKIINNFISEYSHGRTPNPCILCNKFVKFDLFLKNAKILGINKIATGHYAGIEKNDRYLLKRGVAENEQSYFLYRLDQKQLSKIILPLGLYTKQEVRKLAAEFSLPTAQRKKSQDACFLPDGDYGSYLKKFLKPKPGPIINKNGKTIGKHKGVIFYTYGQRKGIGISHKRPYYVIQIDTLNNVVHVGEKDDVFKSKLIAKDLNFISINSLEEKLQVLAKARYFVPLSLATIEPYDDKCVKVEFEEPQWALTPGQSIVFYQDNIVVGGGVIEDVL